MPRRFGVVGEVHYGGHAAVGGILLANETYSLVKGIVLAEADDTIAVKGFSQPIRTYRVVDRYDDLADQSRIIRRDEDGLTLFIDRDKLSKSGKAEAIAALKAAVSRLED